MRQMTFKEYRNLDLMLFAVFVIIFEAIATFASGTWFYAQPIAISLTLTLTCVVMMRWGGYAVIHAMVGGFVYCFASGASIEQYIIYCIGNVLGVVGLLLIKICGKEKIRESKLRLAGFAILSYLGMTLGRGTVSLFFGGNIKTMLVYITTDVISLMFAVILLILLRKTDGMIEDQKTYLFRIQEESKEENISNDRDVIL